MQETYIRAPTPLSEANGDLAPRRGSSRSVSTWLAARAADGRAGLVEAPLPPLHDPEATGVNVPEEALASIDRGSVSRALSKLPEEQRLAIVLMDLAGHSASEVADMLRCPRVIPYCRVFHRGHKRRWRRYSSRKTSPGEL